MAVPIVSLTLATLLAGTLLTFASGKRARWVALATSVVFLFEVTAAVGAFSGWPGRDLTGVPLYAQSETYSWISVSWLHAIGTGERASASCTDSGR